MIQIGETPILLQDPTGAIDRYIEAHHSVDLMRFFGRPAAVNIPRGRNLLFPNYPELPRPKLNQLVIPTGATRWSYGIFLVNTTQKDAILAESAANENKLTVRFGSGDNWKPTPSDPEGFVPTFTLTMSPLPPRPITPTGTQEQDEIQNCWLIPMVDQRYWWQFMNVGVISAEGFYGVQDVVDYCTDKVVNTGNLWLTCPNDKYSSLPDIISSNDYENIGTFIETLAWHIGCQLVPEINETSERSVSLETGFALISVDDSPLIHANNLLGKVGINPGVRDEYGAVTSPDSGFELVGLPNAKMGGQMAITSQGDAFLPATILIPKGVDSTEYYSKTATAVGLTDLKTIAGTSTILRVHYDEITDDIAKQAAKDFFNRFNKIHDYTFAGIQKWQPTAFDDCLVLTQSLFPEGMRVQTRVRSWQQNLFPEQLKSVTGGGVQIIRFQIIEAFCELCQATAVVLSRPPGVTRVYGEDSYGHLRVYDLSQGWLNEPDIDLVNRRGYAALLEWDIDECAINPALNIKWEIMSLMRSDAGCVS